MITDRALLMEALKLTNEDRATARTAVEEDVLMDMFVAEFVAESESLEGYDSKAADVLDASRELASAA
jgi:hypothetical protein